MPRGNLGDSGSVNLFSTLQGSSAGCSEQDAAKPQPAMIETQEARQLFARSPKPLFVDVRTRKEFSTGRIAGAINLPPEEIEQRWNALPRNRTIVLYESGRSSGDICAASRAAGRALLAHGFSPQNVKVYQDGLAGWERAGLPIEH